MEIQTRETKWLSENQAARIYTKIKFEKSQVTDALIGFVSKTDKSGWMKGVRSDSPFPKKICVLDKLLAGKIIPDALYQCTLIPMYKKNGYVVIDAEPVQFKATVLTHYVKNAIYVIEVKFGNKTLRFDPLDGRKASVRNLSDFKAELEKRCDIKNLMQVIDDFNAASDHLMRLMERDKFGAGKKIK